MGWWAWSRAGNTERDGIGAPAPTNRKANGKDDRHDHQPGRYNGGRQDDLPLANQDPSPGRDEHQEERSEQFRKQPAPFEPGVVPLLAQNQTRARAGAGPLPLLVGGMGGFRSSGARPFDHQAIDLTPAVSLSMKWRAKARGRVGRADANHPHVGEGAEAGPPNPHASRRGRDCRRGLRSGRSGRCAKLGPTIDTIRGVRPGADEAPTDRLNRRDRCSPHNTRPWHRVVPFPRCPAYV